MSHPTPVYIGEEISLLIGPQETYLRIFVSEQFPPGLVVIGLLGHLIGLCILGQIEPDRTPVSHTPPPAHSQHSSRGALLLPPRRPPPPPPGGRLSPSLRRLIHLCASRLPPSPPRCAAPRATSCRSFLRLMILCRRSSVGSWAFSGCGTELLMG